MPENLKGYVELVYHLNNNPAIRYLEGLLYKSKYYDPALQSISLSLSEEDGRAFAPSTPRLPDEKKLGWNIPSPMSGSICFLLCKRIKTIS